MDWINFPAFAGITFLAWFSGTILIAVSSKRKAGEFAGLGLIILGLLAMSLFTVLLWIHLERPPLRTLGETRLWYSIFFTLVGLITYFRWRYRLFMYFSVAMAALFLFINYTNPETYSKTLMPALQSPWFVPHVVVYIFAYAVLAFSSVIAVYGLFQVYYRTRDVIFLKLADNLVYIGFAFLTFGLLFGALWAKEAWGHYWTWDPKETWALLTWLAYLGYMHFRHFQPKKYKAPLWALSVAFIILLICWFGINYLPSAQNSVHVYS